MDEERSVGQVVLFKEGDRFEIPFAAASLAAPREGTRPHRLQLLVNDMGVVREFAGGPYRAELFTEEDAAFLGLVTFVASHFVAGYVAVEFEFEPQVGSEDPDGATG